jgi:Arc/MetJ-type ribon-helix-helix transcriptional regulator
MKSAIKSKPKIWALLVSPKLDKQTRKHIAKTKYDSLAEFVRTAVSKHIKDEAQEPDGNSKPVFWILQVPPSLDSQMRSMAKANYSSMSDLIRVAVRKQLEREEIAVTFSRDKNKGDEKT